MVTLSFNKNKKMTKEYEIKGMSCGNCVSKVKDALLKIEGVETAKVQLQFPQAIIKTDRDLPLAVLNDALNKAGHYKIQEAEGVTEAPSQKSGSGCCC